MFSIFETPRFDAYSDWIAAFVTHYAPLSPILLLLLEESGIPLPIPGDAYIAFIGYEASRGRISYFAAFVLLLAAVLIGSSILYYISARWGKILVIKLGDYLHIDEKRIKQVNYNFNKYGVWVIIFGRHIPGFRIPITVFSGISGVPYKTFITSTFISVVFWIAFYLSIGGNLGRHVVSLLHEHHWYFVLFLFPPIIFICSVIYVKIHKK